jgi:hypothetical protein
MRCVPCRSLSWRASAPASRRAWSWTLAPRRRACAACETAASFRAAGTGASGSDALALLASPSSRVAHTARSIFLDCGGDDLTELFFKLLGMDEHYFSLDEFSLEQEQDRLQINAMRERLCLLSDQARRRPPVRARASPRSPGARCAAGGADDRLPRVQAAVRRMAARPHHVLPHERQLRARHRIHGGLARLARRAATAYDAAVRTLGRRCFSPSCWRRPATRARGPSTCTRLRC